MNIRFGSLNPPKSLFLADLSLKKENRQFREPKLGWSRLSGIRIHPALDIQEIEMSITKKAFTATVATAAIVLALGINPAHATGVPKPQQVVTWSWSDNADKSHRDFSESDYDTVADMPTIQLKVTPTNPGRRVVLESYDVNTDTWSQVMAAETDATGIANLQVDPSCDSAGTWCDHDLTYRIRVLKSGTQKLTISHPFTVSFAAEVAGTF